jgi:hypothetical protein
VVLTLEEIALAIGVVLTLEEVVLAIRLIQMGQKPAGAIHAVGRN